MNRKLNRLFHCKWTYLVGGILMFVLQVALMYGSIRSHFPSVWFENFNGNVLSSLLSGVALVFVALFLDHSSSEKVDGLWKRMQEQFEDEAKNRRHACYKYAFHNLYSYLSFRRNAFRKF